MQIILKMPFILCLAALCLFTVIYGSIAMIEDVTIDITDDKSKCDQIECPKDTDWCVVTKHKEFEESTVMIRTDTCYSANKKVLKEFKTNQTVPANSNFDIRIEANRNGNIFLGDYNSSHSFDPRKFNRKMEDFHRKLHNKMAHLNRRLNRMSYELNHMFDS